MKIYYSTPTGKCNGSGIASVKFFGPEEEPRLKLNLPIGGTLRCEVGGVPNEFIFFDIAYG